MTVGQKVGIFADPKSLRIFEDTLKISHSEFEKRLGSLIDTKINVWKNELNPIMSLWNQNKASEAMRKCNTAALDGIENLRIIRGESTKIKLEAPDPETSPFKFS